VKLKPEKTSTRPDLACFRLSISRSQKEKSGRDEDGISMSCKTFVRFIQYHLRNLPSKIVTSITGSARTDF